MASPADGVHALATRGRLRHATEVGARLESEGPRHAERGRPQPYPVGCGEERRQRVIEMREIPQARGPRRRRAGALEIDQQRTSRRHQDVAVVKVAMDVTGGVQCRDPRAERSQKLAATGRASAERFVQRLACDVLHHQQPVAIRKGPAGQGARHRQAGPRQRRERAPLLVERAEAQLRPQPLAPGMQPRADTELLGEQGIALARLEPQDASAGIVVEHRDAASDERVLGARPGAGLSREPVDPRGHGRSCA